MDMWQAMLPMRMGQCRLALNHLLCDADGQTGLWITGSTSEKKNRMLQSRNSSVRNESTDDFIVPFID